jgi:hypothetical protein
VPNIGQAAIYDFKDVCADSQSSYVPPYPPPPFSSSRPCEDPSRSRAALGSRWCASASLIMAASPRFPPLNQGYCMQTSEFDGACLD